MTPDQGLIHVAREAPAWATGIVLTECGNSAELGRVMTHAEFGAYVRKECGGSKQRAYATCCVTCCQTASRHTRDKRSLNPETEQLVDYLRRIPYNRFPGEMSRRNAEVKAIGRLIEMHADQFNQLVRAYDGGLSLIDHADDA